MFASKNFLWTLAIAAACWSTALRTDDAPSDPPADDAKAQATHAQTAIIKVEGDGGGKVTLNTFCLDADGNLLTGIGDGPGEIRKYTPDGKFVSSFKTTVKPEALNIGADGTIYLAGNGKLQKFDSTGNLLLEKKSPHAAALKKSAKKIREQVLAQIKQRAAMMVDQVGLYQTQIDRFKEEIKKIKDKSGDSPSDLDKQRLEAYERAITSYQQVLKSLDTSKPRPKPAKPSEAELAKQVDAMIAYKTRFSSISTNRKDVFVATPALEGYGYEVWRTNLKFGNGEKIVTDLRGCCGQMDVQACGDGVFVAENARHRVGRYDRTGEAITHFGKGDRKGLVGFGSCCNPMNVCFGPGGEVFTAESTIGRIKRFSTDGEFLGLVGTVDIVPGCKKVSIAVNGDGSRVYMMDLTRSHIVVMTRKTDARPVAATTAKID